MAMQKLAIEQVKQERAEGETRLQKAVKVTEERLLKQLHEAVATARQDEKKIAADEAVRVQKYALLSNIVCLSFKYHVCTTVVLVYRLPFY